MTRTVYYAPKKTAANTTYTSLNEEDYNFTIQNIIKTLSYFGELSVSGDENAKYIIKNWYNKQEKRMKFNSKGGRNNSIQSYLSGVLNNVMFGTQYDFTDTQLETLETIFNEAAGLQEKLTLPDLQINKIDKVFYRMKLWTFA